MTKDFFTEHLIKPAVFPASFEENFLIEFFSITDRGTYVDIGGNQPDNAVSKIFWNSDWNGFIVEPLPENAQLFRDAGVDIEECALTSPENATVEKMSFTIAGRQSTLDAQQIMDNRVVTGTIEVSIHTLGELLNKRGWNHLNFLSIDTEGTEVDVLRGIDFNKISCDLILIEDWGRDFSIHRYLTAQGFKRIRRTGFNSWYIPAAVPWSISLYGQLQFFRKFVLSMPFKKLRKWRHEHMESS